MFLSIPAERSKAVWIVSTCPPLSKSSSPFTYAWEIVPCAPIEIDIIVNILIHFLKFYRQDNILISLFAFFVSVYNKRFFRHFSKIACQLFFSPTRIPIFIDWTTSIFSFLRSESNVGVERNRERPVDTCGNHETSGQLGVVKL